jgi:hypothetical protein
MSNQGASGSILVFSGGINHPIPITIPTKHFGTKKKFKLRKKRKWSNKVTRSSDAMDLEPNVFKKSSPKEIAKSIKCSVEKSKRLKSSKLKAGISMMSFMINRAGKNMSTKRKKIIMKAKEEYRNLYKRKSRRSRRSRSSRKYT